MKNTNRDASGRYDHATACDCCGKSTDEDTRVTDDEVCGTSDGPGFFLCARKRCLAKHGALTVEARRELFTARRALNVEAGRAFR